MSKVTASPINRLGDSKCLWHTSGKNKTHKGESEREREMFE